MAKLLKHPFDCVRMCPSPKCGKLTEARYDASQLLGDEHGRISEWKQFTCQACKHTYNADPEPRDGKTLDDEMTITDLREWKRQRDIEAAQLIESDPAPMPARQSAITLLGIGRRYSFVRVG